MSFGKEVKAGFKKAAVWGTPVAVGAADLILITNESVRRSREHLPDDSAGQDFHAASDQGLITCGGDLGAYLRYQGLEVLLAMALGQAGAPDAVGDGGHRHELRLTGDTEGLFGTLAVYKGFSVHEYAGVKVDGFSLEGSAGQPVSVTFNLIADDLAVNTTAGVNTAAGLSALADPAPGNRVLFRQAAFFMNDADDVALTSAHRIAPSRFSLSLRRNLSGDHLAGGDDAVAEPAPTGFPELSLSLEFPTYTSDTYLNDLGADTRKKMMIQFSGGEIESGLSYGLTIQMPHVVLTNAEASVDRAGKIAHPVTASLMAPPEERAGMTGVTAPLALDLVNTRASDPLA